MFIVAGASGRTGRVVAETLIAQGRKVRVLVRNPLEADAWRGRGAEVAFASLEDGPALTRAIDGATGFYALLPETFAAQDFHAHRRRMAEGIAAAVKACRVSHVVFLSAGPAVLPDGNGPCKDLNFAESALRMTGSAVTVIRASYFQENILAALPAAERDGLYPSFFPSAEIAFPTVATRDVGRLAARCFSEPPAKIEVIDLIGPLYSTRQFATKLGSALKRELRVVDIPAAAHVEVLTTQAGLPRQFAEALAEMYACFATGRVFPQGDRMVPGTTTLDEILPALLALAREVKQRNRST
jgi:uncharacterized protein YbjT (DUF2867 family)